MRRIAKYKFSTERLIIADFNNAEKLLSSMVKEILGNKRLFSPTLIMIIQQMVEFPDGISEIEKRAYRDLAEHAGAIEAIVMDDMNEITSSKITSILN
ncbi:rod shape-determining protein [Marinifilum fragile]|uniref:rod shape-determining protein n=1 Tax=Marinifilum fragile TaxID=570161 RepID=UPI0006D2568B|nr:rod shape-determining protein [Marinifilum fragile]